MLNALTLPALVILLGFPFGLPGLGLKHRPAAPPDSLPPAWKTPSRLALEDRFIRARLPTLTPSPTGLRIGYDPRKLRIRFDPDSGTVSAIPEMGDVMLGRGAELPLSAYSSELTRENFRRQWEASSRQSINSLGINSPAQQRGGLSFQLPSPLPRQVQSLLGPGGPALNVSGSENIRLSGQSNWTNQQTGLLGQRQSLFPSLDMQQDLNIQLQGQLSDRIKVNLLQNSINPIPLTNRIAINYKGEEDDLIQALDLGNTNLTLPGTQYVSYSGRNEGLFGVKAASRVGPVDFTILASKQEGRSERASYAGGSSRQNQTLYDLDYQRGTYFLLYDPNIPGDSTFIQAYAIPDTSIRLYRDDYNYGSDQNLVRGRALADPAQADCGCVDSASVRGSFALLNQGSDQDYEILHDVFPLGTLFKVIRLRRPLTGEQRLAVTYARRAVDANGTAAGPETVVGGSLVDDGDGVPALRMKLLRPPVSALRQLANGNFDAGDPITATRDLELRNFYQLPGQNIDPTTFKLSIRKGRDDPPLTFISLPNGTPVPYIELLGLDNIDETTGVPVFRKHDGDVDGTAVNSNARVFVNYNEGTLFFLDLRPFAPRIGAGGKAFEKFLSSFLFRRDSLVGTEGAVNAANPTIYDKYYVQRSLDSRYYIEVEFTAARAAGEIVLGRGNIIDGSDVVTINGQVLARNTDYTIDYDLGRVTLKRQLGPSDQLNVDYSYAPLFQQAGRTLLGSAFRMEGRDRSFGGAFMYESRGAQDLRPRLGEEPSRSLIGDLNTEWTFRPDWMTRLVDRLPGVRTTAPSDLRVQAEVGASFPNPNTKNEVYIDDMEGVRDAVSLSLISERWRWSSRPRPVQFRADLHNSEVRWFTPTKGVKESDLKPTLGKAEGGDNTRQVLGISAPRFPTVGYTPGTPLWTGLTYQLDAVGIDVSRAQFIELWVNDGTDAASRDRMRQDHVKLHIDLGRVSEDQQRSPDVPPDTYLQTEDKVPRDNQLTVTDNNNEDTGLDGVTDDKGEGSLATLDLATAGPNDHSGDDFRNVDETYDELDPRRWLFTNGTENNKSVRPYPDTEDLNLNQNLDTDESYYGYVVDLGDTTFQITDVGNGWRRFRIPLADRDTLVGNPNLTLAQHVRVWLEGFTQPDPTVVLDGKERKRPLFMLGGLDIVGSRWQASDPDSVAQAVGTGVTLNSVNNLDDKERYNPPFNPGSTVSGNLELDRREQSIALEFSNLGAQGEIEAFKSFSINEDYSRYGALSWFVRSTRATAGITASDDSLFYFVRFASDETGDNYYEYRAPIGTFQGPAPPRDYGAGWQRVNLRLTDVSVLKLDPDFPKTGIIEYHAAGPGLSSAGPDSLIIHGRPSFTRLRRVSFGIVNARTDPARVAEGGQLWFDELRAIDVARDVGRAQRVQVNGRMANLMAYNVSWNGRDANFLSVGEARGTGSSTDQLLLSTNFDLHRFFEATGIVLPVNLAYSRNSSKPRFAAGDDIVRTGALSDVSESRNEARSWGANYSRAWSERAHPLLRYTLGGITSSINGTQTNGRTPSSVDTSTTLNATVNYGISPRSILVLKLPGTNTKFYPLPERFFWNYALSTRRSRYYDRLQDSTRTLVLRNDLQGRSGTIAFGADTRPFDFFHHHFEGTRNLTLGDQLTERVGFINLGKVVNWRQAMDARYALSRGPWLNPTLGWRSGYAQNNGPELSSDLSVRSIANSQGVTANWDLPFDRLSRRSAAPSDSGAAGGGGGAVLAKLLSNLGTINSEFSVNWSSAYSRVLGTPSPLYLAGLSRDPGFSSDSSAGRVTAAFGNQGSLARDWRAASRARIGLGFGASVSSRAEVSSRRSESNLVTRRTDSSRFPDLDVDYGRVPNVIGLDRLMNAPRLRTAYNRSRSTDYLSGDVRTGIATSSEWRPLIGIQGDLKNGTRAELRVERRVTERRNFQLGTSVTTDRNTDVNFSLNRQYSQGQKVNVFGKESIVRQTVSLGLAIVYSLHSGETLRDNNSTPQFPVKEDRLSLNANGSYGFSSNVTGNVALGFGQTRDLQRDIVRRNIRVELRGQFTF
ncbi:MAG: cell surface protein SprA [Candidatus Eisenbacteria bacterium RBG_16_71_46]|nr:MAG: cell surface protein SprA [Candidatus Eisenbacteria bacterium RBG_16_71_46]